MSVAFKGLPTLVQLLVDAGANIVMQEVQRFTHIDWSDGPDACGLTDTGRLDSTRVANEG
jgi:hypothetical protein